MITTAKEDLKTTKIEWDTEVPPAIRAWIIEVLSSLPAPVLVDLWGQEQIRAGQRAISPATELVLRIDHPGVIRQLFSTRDALVLIEALCAGYVSIDGNTDALNEIGRYCFRPQSSLQATIKAWFAAHKLPTLPLRPQKPSWSGLTVGSLEHNKQTVQYHFDVSNEFYALWLDPQMVYTCAHFEGETMSLAEAQEAKLETICRKLQLKAGDYLLDIGCGWGGLLRWAATKYGVRGHGVTVSQEQLDYARHRIDQEGLSDRIKVDLMDYRQLPQEPTYDKIASVGVIEHVGPDQYRTFFRRAYGALKPGGLYLNHSIATYTPWHGYTIGERFIQRFIFPDSKLGTLSTIIRAMERSGWEVVDVESWRPHYARTCRQWASNLDSNMEKAEALVGRAKALLWKLYLQGSALAFEDNHFSLYQVLVRRCADQAWSLPMLRHGWLS